MHGNEITISTDLPVLLADWLADTDVLDRALAALGRFCTAVPLKLAAWLGSELRTPENSAPPRVVAAEPGPWNGLVFVEHDEPRFWVFAKAGGRSAREQVHPPVERFSPTYDERHGWPPGAQRGPAMWSEHEEPEWYGSPMEPRPWRGGP